jgi:hypothetical protein
MAQKPISRIACAPAATREQLVAYLTYAVDEVAFYSESGALLLRMAISDLEAEARPTHSDAVHKLS